MQKSKLDTMKIGFDNDKYLKIQSEHIRERIAQFDGKLYMELGGKLFDDHHEAAVHKLIAQSQCVFVVCDAEVGSYLVLLDVFGIHHDDNLDAVSQLCQHAQL